ncbi:MAG: VOC family protein [Acidobacteriota bacterium]|nr:VOC family protein [Acidobacteriota bacterium]
MAALTAGEMKGRLVPNWRMLENMLTHFPKAVPEIPVSNVEKAAEYYVNVLGFHFDWGNDHSGIGAISQGECRIFLTNAPFSQHYGNGGTVMNLDSKHEVDELYHRWREAGAKILAEPEDKPWHLREFRVADLDGNGVVSDPNVLLTDPQSLSIQPQHSELSSISKADTSLLPIR